MRDTLCPLLLVVLRDYSLSGNDGQKVALEMPHGIYTGESETRAYAMFGGLLETGE